LCRIFGLGLRLPPSLGALSRTLVVDADTTQYPSLRAQLQHKYSGEEDNDTGGNQRAFHVRAIISDKFPKSG